MKRYELAVVLHPDLEIDMDTPLEMIDELLKGVDAKTHKRDDWGKRKLAYPINKQNFGIYVFYQIEMPGENVTKLERNLKLSDEVLRHLVVSFDEAAAAAHEAHEKAQAEKAESSKQAKKEEA